MYKQLFVIVACIPVLSFSQHSIKGTFSPAEHFENAILYKVTPTESLYIAHTIINKGTFEIVLDSTVTEGMYRLVYALPQEEFNFDIIYNAKEDIELNFDLESGINYLSSKENKLIASYTNNMSLITESIGNFYREQKTDSLALALLFNAQDEIQTNFEEASKGMIASNFIKANRPYIPEGFQDKKTYIQNLKVHFFDHVDFNNGFLQSSNFLIERTLNYVFGMSSESDDDSTIFKNNIDDLANAMRKAKPKIKAILFEILWQQMVDADFEFVANYISDTYLMALAKVLNDQELANGLSLFKSLSIGKTAPDFQLEIEKDGIKVSKNLSELKIADTYIIVFWSNSCSHCLKEIPLLQSYVNQFEKGKFKVIAIGLEDEPFGWRKRISEYPEFIHVLGFGKWDNEIGNSYNVISTPTYYVLDKNKSILAKPVDIEALKKFFED